MLPLKQRVALGLSTLERIRPWLGTSQAAFVADLMRRSEERDFFIGKMIELEGIITTMPSTRGQDGLGDQAIVYLHYFMGGYDAWITEKDIGDPDDLPEEFQNQMFGFSRYGLRDPSRLGYISLPEIRSGVVELDFHWTPTTVGDIRRSKEDREPVAASVTGPAANPAPAEITTRFSKTAHGHQGETFIGRWRISTMRRSSGRVTCTALLCDLIEPGGYRYTSSSRTHSLAASDSRATEAEIRRVHTAGLARFHQLEPAACSAPRPPDLVPVPVPEPVSISAPQPVNVTTIAAMPNPLASHQLPFTAMEDGFQPGAILYSSWGWEQTNIDWYRIVKRSGEWLTLMPIRSATREEGFMAGHCCPQSIVDAHGQHLPVDRDPAIDNDVAWKNREAGLSSPTFRRKLQLLDGKPSSTTIKYGFAYLWHGQPVACSWYA
jgi:hypothetical protein